VLAASIWIRDCTVRVWAGGPRSAERTWASTLKVGSSIVLVIVGFVLGAVATHFYREHSIRDLRAHVEGQQEALDSLLTIIIRDQGEIEKLHIRLKVQRDSLNKLIDEAKARQTVLAKEVKALSDSIEGQLPDHLRPAFYRLRQAHQEQIELFQAEIIAKDAIIISQDSLIDRYYDTNADLQDALLRSEALREYWEDEAHRDWWEKPQFTAPLAIGGTVAALLAIKTVVD
jgi:hypothetical protein